MLIGYLASAGTLPGAGGRRADAFEHDLMVEAVARPLAARGGAVEAVAWDDPAADWSRYDGVLIGSPWDYQDRLADFLAVLEAIEAARPLFNPAAIVRWNSRKTYLRDLAANGAATIPTLWLDSASPGAVAQAFEALATDDLVLKRQIGAGAEGQHRLRRGDSIPAMPHPMMAQPFLPAIAQEGEFSLIFVDGAFSHGVRKRALPGDYRIQAIYGGTNEAFALEPADEAAAAAIVAMLPETPLYARVDMVRGEEGELLLMEFELIEPYLYPEQGPELGERLVAAIERRLER